ncbi:MAG: hypothetical protein R3F11_20935 [Verrucomicrobiales bacterium]
MQERFGVPVAVINDVDSGTYGEIHRRGGARRPLAARRLPRHRRGRRLHLRRARLLRGKRYSAMEIGNLRWYGGARLRPRHPAEPRRLLQ